MRFTLKRHYKYNTLFIQSQEKKEQIAKKFCNLRNLFVICY